MGFCSRARGSAWAGGARTVCRLCGTSLPRLLCMRVRVCKGGSVNMWFHRLVRSCLRQGHDDVMLLSRQTLEWDLGVPIGERDEQNA